MNRRERTQSPTPRFRRKIWGPKLSVVDIDETIGLSDSSNSLNKAEKRNGESYLASDNVFRQTDLHSFFGMLPDDATQDDSDEIFSDGDNSNVTNSDEINEIMQKKMEEVALSVAMSGVGRRDRHACATAVARSRSASIVRKKHDKTTDDNNRDGTKGADGHTPTKRGASQPPPSKPGLVMRGLLNSSESVEGDVEQRSAPTISITRLSRSSSVPRRFPPKITRFCSAKENPTSPFSAFNVVSPRESNVKTDSPDIPYPIAFTSPQHYESPTLLSECASPDSPSQDLIQPNWQSSPASSPSNSQTSPSSRDVTDSPAASTPNWISSNSSCDIPNLDISKPSKHASPGRSVDTSVTSANSITSIDDSSQNESNDNFNCDTVETERSHSQDCMPLPNQETYRIQSGGASTPRTALLEKCGWTHHHRFARHRSRANVNPTPPKIVRLNHVSSAVIVDADYGKNLFIPKESVGIQTGTSLDELDGKFDLVTDAFTNDDDVTNAVGSEVYEAMVAELADLRAWKEEALANTDKYADEVETLKVKLQTLTNQCDEQQKLLNEKMTEISTLESKVRQESSSSNEQHDELAAKTIENQDLRQRLALLNAAKYDAEAEMEVLKLNAQHLRESNEKLKKEAASLTKDITKWRVKADELEDAQVQVEHLEVTLEGKCEENKSLHERVRELEADLEKRRSDSWRSNARIDTLQDKVHDGLIKINSLSDELENLREENKNLHKELEEKADESRSLETQAMALRLSHNDLSTKVTELTAENKNLRCVVSTLEKDRNDAKKSNENDQVQRANLGDKISFLRSERDAMTAKVTDLLMENGRFHEVVVRLEDELDKTKKFQDEALIECQYLESSATSLQSESAEVTKLLALNEELQNVNASLEKDLNHTKKSLEKCRNNCRSHESSFLTLNSERDDRSIKISDLLRENEHAKRTIDKLKVELDESKNSFEENVLECKYLESLVQSLKSERDETSNKVEEVLEENESLRVVINSFNDVRGNDRKLFEESHVLCNATERTAEDDQVRINVPTEEALEVVRNSSSDNNALVSSTISGNNEMTKKVNELLTERHELLANVTSLMKDLGDANRLFDESSQSHEMALDSLTSKLDELFCRVKELTVENDQVRISVATLEEELEETKKSSSDNEALVASLKSDRDELSKKVNELLTERDELLANVASLKKDLGGAKRDFNESCQSHETALTLFASERDELSCEMKELMAESDPVHDVIATFKKELKEAKKSSSDNEAFEASLKSERDRMSTNILELSAETAENEQVDSLIKALEKDRDEAMRLCHASTAKCQSFEEMGVSLKSERDILTSKVSQLTFENERVRDDLTSIVASEEEEISSCCSKIARIESEFTETKKTLELKTAALQNLKVQLSESQSIICKKEEMILNLELDLDKISSQASAQLSEIDELRSLKSIAEETIAKQGNELATLRSAVAKKALLESTIEKLAKEVAIKESEVSHVLDDLSVKEKSIASLQIELHDAVSRRDQLLQEVHDLNDWKESAQQNINNLQSESILNASEIDRLAQELSHRKKEVGDLQSSIVNLKIKVAEKISTISELSGIFKSKEDEIFYLRSEVETFEKKEVTATQEINQLREQNTTANNIITDLEAKLHGESHNVVTFRQELEKSKESCMGLEDEITMLMDEIQFLHESMHTEKADFDNVLRIKNSEMDALRAENFDLLESIKRLNDDVQNIKDTHKAQLIERHNVKHELEASIAEKENKISSLNEELKKATDQLNEMQSKALSMSLMTGPLSSEISELRELKYAADKNMEKQAEVVDELKKQVFHLTSQCDEKSKCLANKQAELLEIEQKFYAESLSKAEIVSRFEDELLEKSKLIDKLSTGQKHAITHFEETLGKMTNKLTEKEEECERLRNDFERREKMIGDLVAQLSELNEEKLSMAQNALDMATEFEEKIFVLQLSAERAHILEVDLERQRSKYDQARKALEALEKTLTASSPSLVHF